jgi:HPt (histidine-containing phosphotransfer) domain-containing protein
MIEPDMHSGLAPIRDRFLLLLSERQDSIQQNLELAIQSDDLADQYLAHIEATLHKIAGSAGTLGFSELGDRAKATETNIISQRTNGATQYHDICFDIIAFLECSIEATCPAV